MPRYYRPLQMKEAHRNKPFQTQGATPYRFSYDTSRAGGAFHQEVGDALGNKRGFYGLPGRRVYYVADEGGFRASVGSNEPGVDISKDPADVVFTGSPNSGPIPLPPPSPSSEVTGDDGLVFPPPYAGGGSDSNDFGDQGVRLMSSCLVGSI
ncbi:hypothetical protein HPB48_017234 [Haemaphysalis longicornis]|uniref:Cuticular protein n=1 Tax=Haemaphysalis longicornis TaxID=44386 RepID=A0A9J6GZY6_HAELO|nr:hypothetical protein HPB48_017234 [Haemaphysalis longicornis]